MLERRRRRLTGARPTSRAGIALTAVLVAGGALTGCSNGVEAGTLDPPSFTGVRSNAGDLYLRNVVLVARGDGLLTLSGTVVNSGDEEDALTTVWIDQEGEQVEAELDPRSVEIAPGAATVIPGEDETAVEIEADVLTGSFVDATLEFERAGRVEMTLPVIPTDSWYAG